MKYTQKEIDKNSDEAIRTCLQNVPFVRILSIEKERRFDNQEIDLVGTVEVSDKQYQLVFEIKINGQPRIARNAVNKLMRVIQNNPEMYGVFIAPYVSEKSAQICKEEGVGYLDFAGNCFLSFKNIFIEREGNPNPFKQKRYLRSLYSPKSERILRVLLSEPGTTWITKDLAKKANTSYGQVSNVRKQLADREWIRTDTRGIALIQPAELLDDWSQYYNFRRNSKRYYYSLKEIPAVEVEIASFCRENDLIYAFTGFSGAARFSPHVLYKQVMLYIENEKIDPAGFLPVKEVTSGANLLLLTPYDEGVFFGMKEIDGIMIANPIQIFLDLIGFRGRGEEAAKSLLENVIMKQW